MALAATTFLAISAIISVFFFDFGNRPIKKLIATTRFIGRVDYEQTTGVNRNDEIRQLSRAIGWRRRSPPKEEELNKQRDEYQNLLEQAPCYITVQDKDLRILQYNREMATQFAPKPGDYCYQAYKCRHRRCEICPVLQTFAGRRVSHGSGGGDQRLVAKPTGLSRTTPIPQVFSGCDRRHGNQPGHHPIETPGKRMRESEVHVKASLITYPMPSSSWTPTPCTFSTAMIASRPSTDSPRVRFNRSFLDLFEERTSNHSRQLQASPVLNQVRQVTKNGQTIFVNIQVSPSEYLGQEALLLVASNITQRLQTEQQLIQASKMATLGEMSAGVAHELNQPAHGHQTASNYLLRKIRKRNDCVPTCSEPWHRRSTAMSTAPPRSSIISGNSAANRRYERTGAD